VPSDELADASRGLGMRAEAAPTIAAGLEWALSDASDADLVFVSGSLYLVGAARSLLVTQR
jgi:folylpolyglutamate synthase/dihydropteroate synthase